MLDNTQIVVNIELIKEAADKFENICSVGEFFKKKLKETPHTYKKWFGLKKVKTNQLDYAKKLSCNNLRSTGSWAYTTGLVEDKVIGDAIDISYRYYDWSDWGKYGNKVFLSESDYNSLLEVLDFDLSHLINCLEEFDKE